jgi:branched-chain amino acid transport system permease protein
VSAPAAVPARAPAAAAGGLATLRWSAWEVVFWVLPVAGFFLFPNHLTLGSQIFITALFALSLDLILGYARIISLGHAAFFGLGAYTVGVLAKYGWNEPLTGLVAGALVAAAAGWVTSFLVVRGQDLARLMVTLGIGLMLFEAANQAAWLTGGVDGLSVEMGKVFGVFGFDLRGRTAYAYSLAVLFVVFCVARVLVRSPFGLGLKGIREGERRMPALGVSVRGKLTSAYTIGAGIAGIAGALLAQTTQFVGIDVFSFQRSADLMIVLVLGGAGYLYGGLVGASLFMLLQDVLAKQNPVYWQFWLGLLLVLLVLFARGGVLGGIAAVRARRQERRG